MQNIDDQLALKDEEIRKLEAQLEDTAELAVLMETVRDKLKKVQLKSPELAAEIEKLEARLEAAESSLEKVYEELDQGTVEIKSKDITEVVALIISQKSLLRKEIRALRKEKSGLHDEKRSLRRQEMRLLEEQGSLRSKINCLLNEKCLLMEIEQKQQEVCVVDTWLAAILSNSDKSDSSKANSNKLSESGICPTESP